VAAAAASGGEWRRARTAGGPGHFTGCATGARPAAGEPGKDDGHRVWAV